MSQKTVINLLKKKEVQKIFKNAGIEHLRLFGSYANNDYNKDSDIDLLYAYNPKKTKAFGGVFSVYGNIQEYIKQKIDLVSCNTLKPELKDSVLKSSIEIY